MVCFTDKGASGAEVADGSSPPSPGGLAALSGSQEHAAADLPPASPRLDGVLLATVGGQRWGCVCPLPRE